MLTDLERLAAITEKANRVWLLNPGFPVPLFEEWNNLREAIEELKNAIRLWGEK